MPNTVNSGLPFDFVNQRDFKERWRTVIGWEGYYKVSTLGRVKSLARIVVYRNGQEHYQPTKMLKPAWNGNYYHVIFSRNRVETLYLVHRLVLETFVSPCPEGMECRHEDGDPTNNKLKNLSWNSHKKNIHDKFRHGTTTKGRSGGTHKLTGKTEEIAKLKRYGWTVDEITEHFKVRRSTVYYHLRKGRCSHA